MKIKRLLSMVLALLMLLPLCACGGIKGNQADTDAVRAAVDKFSACSSFTVNHVTARQESYSLEGQQYSYSGSSETELSLITAPVPQMKTVSTAKMVYEGEVMEQRNMSYVVPETGGYAEYISDGNDWYKITTGNADALSGFDAASLAEAFFTDSIMFRKAGTETIDGIEAGRYEGSLSGDELVNLLDINGLLYSISQMSENQQNKIRTNLAKDMGAVTVCVWLDEASGYPVRFEVNISEILKDAQKSIAKTLGTDSSDGQWAISEYVVSMSVSDINALSEIVLPAEAADAIPYEEVAATE